MSLKSINQLDEKICVSTQILRKCEMIWLRVWNELNFDYQIEILVYLCKALFIPTYKFIYNSYNCDKFFRVINEIYFWFLNRFYTLNDSPLNFEMSLTF